MPKLRNLGQLSQILLQAHLRNKAAQEDDERTFANQRDLADYQAGLRQQERDDILANDEWKTALADPTGGVADAIGRSGLISPERRAAPILGRVSQAKSQDEVPTEFGLGKELEGRGVSLGPSEKEFWAGEQTGGGDTLPARMPASQSGLWRDAKQLRTDQLKQIGINQEGEADRKAADAYNQAFNQGKGTEAATADAFPAKLEREKTEFTAMTPLEVDRAGKIATAQALADLDKQKKLWTFQLAQAGQLEQAKQIQQMTLDAASGIASIEELGALAYDVNKDFNAGGMDIYAGVKDAFGQVPYLGGSLRQLMTTAGGTGSAIASGDSSQIRKAQRLEAMRNETARKFIVAAGDPRPSDADIAGMLPLFPGAFESRDATQEKMQYIRDTAVMIPEIAAKHPGVYGKALFDLAYEESKKRSAGRVNTPKAQAAPTQVTPLTANLDAIMSR